MPLMLAAGKFTHSDRETALKSNGTTNPFLNTTCIIIPYLLVLSLLSLTSVSLDELLTPIYNQYNR